MDILRYICKGLHLFEVRRINTDAKIVYLTFDDGPEEGSAQEVIDILAKYGFKATFFCRGDNAEKNPQLVELLRSKGHAIGNHTYSHIHGRKTPTDTYLNDVEKANVVLQTNLFRPPWGALSISSFLKLSRKYHIIYWRLVSGDTDMDKFDLEKNFNNLITNTNRGDVVLFHFCNRHIVETRKILPLYCEWLNRNGWISLPL